MEGKCGDMVKIELVDGGATRYEQKPSGHFLGRKYDDKAEQIEVVRPERESGKVCTMWVKANGELVDAINVGDDNVVEVRNNISQFDKVCVGFTFTDNSGYLKNSEVVEYYFAEGIKPEDFTPVEPEQKAKLQLLLGMAFADAEWDEENPNAIDFYNIDGELRKQFEISGGSRTQSDWEEDDPTDPAYIKNKPTIPTMPTKTSDLTNDGHDGTHPFVDSADLAVVESGLNEAQQDIQGLKNRVGTAETDIENLEGSINQVADDLATETTNRTNAINELKTDSAHSLELSMNNTTYVMTAILKNSDGTALSTQTIDFPLETLVLSVSYDSATKELVITLKNGTTTRVSVADLVSGLVPNTRKVNGKVLSSDISLTAENVGALPDDTFIPTNTSDLNNDSGFVTESDLPTVNNATITLTQGGVSKGSFTLNQSGDTTIELDEGGGGTPTDVQVNGTSITQNNIANLITETAYNATTNKIATMADINNVMGSANRRIEDVLFYI